MTTEQEQLARAVAERMGWWRHTDGFFVQEMLAELPTTQKRWPLDAIYTRPDAQWAMESMGCVLKDAHRRRDLSYWERPYGASISGPHDIIFDDANLLRDFRRFAEREWGIYTLPGTNTTHSDCTAATLTGTTYSTHDPVRVPHDGSDASKNRAEAEAVLRAIHKAKGAMG